MHTAIRHSAFFFNSKFPPSLHCLVISEAHQDEIARGFLMSLDSLLLPLLSFRPFVEVVLSKTLGRFKSPEYAPVF